MTPTNTTNSANAVGGMSALQSNMSNMAGLVAPPMGGGLNGLGGTNQSGMDALSQAYSGIQQYAGLSSLLNQGKGQFHDIFFSVADVLCCVACSLPPSLARYIDTKARNNALLLPSIFRCRFWRLLILHRNGSLEMRMRLPLKLSRNFILLFSFINFRFVVKRNLSAESDN